MQFIRNIKAAYAAFIQSQADLADAVRANTAAVTAGRVVAEETAAAAKATQRSTAYLEAAKRNDREHSGKPPLSVPK